MFEGNARNPSSEAYRPSTPIPSCYTADIFEDRTAISFRYVRFPTYCDRLVNGNRKFILSACPVKNEMEGAKAKLIISQPTTLGLAREFRQSVAYSVGILGDQVANLFYYHARQNYNVDPSRLPQDVEKFDQALRSLLGTGAIVVVRECAKRLSAVLGVRIEPFPDNLTSLYRKVSESYRLEKWAFPLELMAR